jgi:hypothetical protein
MSFSTYGGAQWSRGVALPLYASGRAISSRGVRGGRRASLQQIPKEAKADLVRGDRPRCADLPEESRSRRKVRGLFEGDETDDPGPLASDTVKKKKKRGASGSAGCFQPSRRSEGAERGRWARNKYFSPSDVFIIYFLSFFCFPF